VSPRPWDIAYIFHTISQRSSVNIFAGSVIEDNVEVSEALSFFCEYNDKLNIKKLAWERTNNP
jgi:hypothetical protein